MVRFGFLTRLAAACNCKIGCPYTTPGPPERSEVVWDTCRLTHEHSSSRCELRSGALGRNNRRTPTRAPPRPPIAPAVPLESCPASPRSGSGATCQKRDGAVGARAMGTTPAAPHLKVVPIFPSILAASRGGVIFEVGDGFVRPASECLSTRTSARYH